MFHTENKNLRHLNTESDIDQSGHVPENSAGHMGII